jgi:hypothetical protein
MKVEGGFPSVLAVGKDCVSRCTILKRVAVISKRQKSSI